MKKILYVHVGTTKTGTTAIQSFMIDNQEVLNQKGYYYPLFPYRCKDVSERRNARFMLEGKRVLLLLASITTGGTVRKGTRCIQYYGGSVAGVASIYSHLKDVDGVPVISLFDTSDLPGYASYSPEECPLCKQGVEVDAVVDKFGYSKL